MPETWSETKMLEIISNVEKLVNKPSCARSECDVQNICAQNRCSTCCDIIVYCGEIPNTIFLSFFEKSKGNTQIVFYDWCRRIKYYMAYSELSLKPVAIVLEIDKSASRSIHQSGLQRVPIQKNDKIRYRILYTCTNQKTVNGHTQCGIYHTRPEVCSEYFCHLFPVENSYSTEHYKNTLELLHSMYQYTTNVFLWKNLDNIAHDIDGFIENFERLETPTIESLFDYPISLPYLGRPS